MSGFLGKGKASPSCPSRRPGWLWELNPGEFSYSVNLTMKFLRCDTPTAGALGWHVDAFFVYAADIDELDAICANVNADFDGSHLILIDGDQVALNKLLVTEMDIEP